MTSDRPGAGPQPFRMRASLALKVALVPLAVPLAVFLFLTAQSKSVEAKAWPVIRTITRRLQSDDGARRLYQANPALAESYRDEATFLQLVQIHRAQYADLADRPPSTDAYSCQAGPNGFRATLRGSAGTWIAFEVRQDVLLEKVPGEGLLHLEFSPAQEVGRRRLAR